MRRARIALVVVALMSLSLTVRAQAPDSITGNAAPSASGPTPGTETIKIKDLDVAIHLRFRGIYPHSEAITLDGQQLARGTDYNIDYGSGTLYLMRQVNVDQVLRLTYQYDAASQISRSSKLANASPAIKSQIPLGEAMGAPAHLNFNNSNMLALNSNMRVGGINSSGMMMFSSNGTVNGTRDWRADLSPAGSYQQPKVNSDVFGNSQFVLQNFSSKLSGGTVSFDYQDVSRNFGAFNMVRASGMDDSVVNQLEKEAGIKRMGFSMQDVGLGSAKISNSFKSVSDDGGSITWKSFGLQSGGLKVNYDDRHIDPGFSRFHDLAENDRDQLLKEAGMSRRNIGAEYDAKSAKLAFASTQITDEFGQSISKNSMDFSSKNWKLNFGEQSVGSAFARLDSLTDPEKAAFSHDIGINRKWFNLEASPFGKGAQPVKVALEDLSTSTGNFRAEDVSGGAKNWTASFSERKMDPNFGLQSNLTDAEVDQNVQAIAKMYQGGAPTSPGDRNGLLQGPAVDRSAFRFTATPRKDWNLDIGQVTLRDSLDYISLQSLTLNTKNLDFSAKREHEGVNFTETPMLFGFEQQKLGNVPGLDLTNMALNWRLGGMKKLSMSLLDSNTPSGGAKREQFAYSDKNIDIGYNSRNVAPGFSSVSNLADPENGLLASLMGFRESDFHLKWNILPKLTMETLWADQKNDTSNVDAFQHNVLINWDPNKTTHLSYTMLDTKSDNVTDLLYRNRISQFLLAKDFGKYGKLNYIHENDTVEDPNGNPAPPAVGPQAPSPDPNLPQGDATKDYISYEAQIDKKTSIKAEQTLTRFANGTKEDISANTINRALTNNFGLSYTDMSIDRPGTDKDERKHNYGIWYDIAKGVRLSYGLTRDMDNINGNSATSQIGLTPGNAGLLHVDALSYGDNSWDHLHNQVGTNLQLRNSKPTNFGFIKNMQFNLGMDTSSDYSAWQRDNRLFNLSGNIGSNSFMVEYKSQLDNVTNLHGIDRFVKLETDQGDKRWLKASIKLKQREIPGQGTTTIRDYNITLKPAKNLELTNQVLTNPEEQFRPDVLLGSLTSPWRVNKYALSYHSGKDTAISGTWEDRRNDLTRDFSRTGGLSMEFFKNSGSPLTLWYGIEQGGGNMPRQTAQRYYLKFYQKPGPNQVFNIFAGNISYEYIGAEGFSKNNWTLHLDYEYKFW